MNKQNIVNEMMKEEIDFNLNGFDLVGYNDVIKNNNKMDINILPLNTIIDNIIKEKTNEHKKLHHILEKIKDMERRKTSDS